MKLKSNRKITAVIIFLGLFLFVNVGFAAVVTCGKTVDNPKECTLVDLVYTVVNIINYLLAWAWLVAIFFIVYSGYGMATSAGNEEKLTTAKAGLDNAITGFFLIMVSYLLINWAVGVLAGPNAPGAGQGFLQKLIDTLKTLPI